MIKLSEKRGFWARDPWVISHNGQYYHCYTPDWQSIWVSCAPTLEALGQAQGVQVYVPENREHYGALIWAPELHIIDGRCYIYAACSGTDHTRHRMCVMENGSDNPLERYHLHGKITDKTDFRAIDGTVMKYQGKLYFIWAGCRNDDTLSQDLYIATMADPFTISGDRMMISTPDQPWEVKNSVGPNENLLINEGPCAFEAEGRTYVLYSADGGWDADYCMGILELTGSDPMAPDAWKKHPGPVLASGGPMLGPGHGSVLPEERKICFAAWDKSDEQLGWDTVQIFLADYRFENGRIKIFWW